MPEDATALRAAIDLLHVPSRARLFRSQPLPPGMGLLLAIAAGDADGQAQGADLTGRTPETVRDAAVFFVEQILLAPDSDSYRILGASADSDGTELRRNMALLVRAFHPDLSENKDRSVFAQRVTRAWEYVKTADRRELLDAGRKDGAMSPSLAGLYGSPNGGSGSSAGSGSPSSQRARQKARMQRMAETLARRQQAEEEAGGGHILRRALLYLLGRRKN